VHWTYDTTCSAHATGQALVKAWRRCFFPHCDYAFGARSSATHGVVLQRWQGRRQCRHPMNTSDFSSFVLMAQSSKAKIIGLANASGDTTNSVKQAAEFGILRAGKSRGASLLLVNDVKASVSKLRRPELHRVLLLGPERQTRAFSKRFAPDRTARPDHGSGRVHSGLTHSSSARSNGGNPHDGTRW